MFLRSVDTFEAHRPESPDSMGSNTKVHIHTSDDEEDVVERQLGITFISFFLIESIAF